MYWTDFRVIRIRFVRITQDTHTFLHDDMNKRTHEYADTWRWQYSNVRIQMFNNTAIQHDTNTSIPQYNHNYNTTSQQLTHTKKHQSLQTYQPTPKQQIVLSVLTNVYASMWVFSVSNASSTFHICVHHNVKCRLIIQIYPVWVADTPCRSTQPTENQVI